MPGKQCFLTQWSFLLIAASWGRWWSCPRCVKSSRPFLSFPTVVEDVALRFQTCMDGNWDFQKKTSLIKKKKILLSAFFFGGGVNHVNCIWGNLIIAKQRYLYLSLYYLNPISLNSQTCGFFFLRAFFYKTWCQLGRPTTVSRLSEKKLMSFKFRTIGYTHLHKSTQL